MPINLDSIANLSPELQRVFSATLRAETKPIQQAEERKSHVEERMKLLNDVLAKVDEVRKLLPNMSTPMAIREFNVNSTDEGIATGTADKLLAEMGEHSLEVLELASSATALSNRFPDKDKTRIGTGYFTFYGPDGESKEVFIDNENATLEGIARVINGAGVGMKASVVNDQTDSESPYRLILTASGYGKDQDVQYPEFYFIDGDEDFYIESERPATNARIRYQGFELELPSNEANELIAGVNLNLKGTTPEGKPLGISVEQDIPKTAVKMKEIVDGINAVLGFIQGQNKMNADTPGHKTLGGDYGIRMAEQRIRDVIQNNFMGNLDGSSRVKLLSDLGVEFQKDGLLKFDEDKFSAALDANFDATVRLLSGDGMRPGFMNNLAGVLASLSTPGTGLLANQKTTYMEKIQRMDRDIKAKEERLEKRAELLKNKLAKVQGALSQLQSQQGSVGGIGGAAMGGPPSGGGPGAAISQAGAAGGGG